MTRTTWIVLGSVLASAFVLASCCCGGIAITALPRIREASQQANAKMKMKAQADMTVAAAAAQQPKTDTKVIGRCRINSVRQEVNQTGGWLWIEMFNDEGAIMLIDARVQRDSPLGRQLFDLFKNGEERVAVLTLRHDGQTDSPFLVTGLVSH